MMIIAYRIREIDASLCTKVAASVVCRKKVNNDGVRDDEGVHQYFHIDHQKAPHLLPLVLSLFTQHAIVESIWIFVFSFFLS